MYAAKRSLAPVQVPPPLPDIAAPGSAAYAPDQLPAVGCYLINYTPAAGSLTTYDGTLRVDAATGRLLASGDLYGRPVIMNDETLEPALGRAPDPAAGIPIFPLKSYRYYLRVGRIEVAADTFTLVFDACRFSLEPAVQLGGSSTLWPKESTLTARLARAVAPAGFPMPQRYFAGDVADETGTIAGRLTMGWVSSSLRRASVEVDRLPVAKFPTDAGAGATWKSLFAEVGWDLTVIPGDENVPDSGGEFWSGADAHKAMDLHAEGTDFNKEWRYYILAVRRIKSVMAPQLGERGYMFDKDSDDLDNLPRQGLLIASDWPIPSTREWGRLGGKSLGETVAYFRTAVHELGHALGLDHNESDNGIMCTTDKIAARSVGSGSVFPDNIQWSFASDDAHRLRHWPDNIVRPGGVGWFPNNPGPIQSILSDKLRLEAAPVARQVPLGAPVRIDLRLINTTPVFSKGPLRLSLMAGSVRGSVIDASGTVRMFAPLVVNENPDAFDNIAPGASLDGSLTVLRGPQGALFPAAGAYRVVVEAQWRSDNLELFAVSETRVTVTPAVDAAHAEAARRVLSTPQTLLVLALGGDHVEEGIAAIDAALANQTLHAHFAYIEAKRRATRFADRAPDLAAAAALIDNTTVMSAAEVTNAVEIVLDNADNPAAPALAGKLRAWAAVNPVGDRVRALIESLP